MQCTGLAHVRDGAGSLPSVETSEFVNLSIGRLRRALCLSESEELGRPQSVGFAIRESQAS
jgi:hypothetical protein